MTETKQDPIVPRHVYFTALLLAFAPILWTFWKGSALPYWVSFPMLCMCFAGAAWLRHRQNGVAWWSLANGIGAMYPTLLSVVPYFRTAGIDAMRIAGVLSAIAFWLIAASGAEILERVYRHKRIHLRTHRRYGEPRHE